MSFKKNLLCSLNRVGLGYFIVLHLTRKESETEAAAAPAPKITIQWGNGRDQSLITDDTFLSIVKDQTSTGQAEFRISRFVLRVPITHALIIDRRLRGRIGKGYVQVPWPVHPRNTRSNLRPSQTIE